MEKIILFGAGTRLDAMMEINKFEGYDIVAIVDSDEKKQNELCYGHIIQKPEDIHKLDYDRIIISSEKYFDEIKKMLVDDLNISSVLIGNITMDKYDFELSYWQNQYKKEGGRFNNTHYKALMLAIAEEENDDFWQGRVVADFGCGPRGSLAWTDTPAIKLGIDVLASRYMKLFGDELKTHNMVYVVSDEKRIMIPDNYVDCLLTMNSLDHVADMGAMVSEILRILKPGGQLLASFNLNEPPTVCEPLTLTEELLNEHFLKYFKIISYRKAFKDEKEISSINLFKSQRVYEPDNNQPILLWVKGEKL